ncbi:hypothetical protein QE379_002229 [Sphingomonas sp. SORGH_AS 879]|nr:hypothetical protein [Sphingomonas sp. SORGH_AS_0879]
MNFLMGQQWFVIADMRPLMLMLQSDMFLRANGEVQ